MEREEQPEHEEQAEQMEEDAERMDEESDRVGEHIEEARADWEQKERDPAVPGAQPDPDEDVASDEEAGP